MAAWVRRAHDSAGGLGSRGRGESVTGKALVELLWSRAPLPRPPYVPLIGELALALGQVTREAYVADPQVQARVLLEAAGSLGADVVTVGVGADPAVGVDVVERIKPLLGGRAVAACLAAANVAAARAYCEAGVDMVLLVAESRSDPARFRTLANACAFYSVPVILVGTSLEDAAAFAAESGLHGAVVERPTGDEAGIVGGGLSRESFAASSHTPPRGFAFFWAFPGEVPTDIAPEDLAALGARLTA